MRMYLLGFAECRASLFSFLFNFFFIARKEKSIELHPTTRSLPPEVLERAGLPKSDAKGSDAADR